MKANQAESDDSDDLKLAVQIMAGLLASGHFTEIGDDEISNGPAATRYSPGVGDRLRVDAVDEAVELLKRLKEELDADHQTPKKRRQRTKDDGEGLMK